MVYNWRIFNEYHIVHIRQTMNGCLEDRTVDRVKWNLFDNSLNN